MWRVLCEIRYSLDFDVCTPKIVLLAWFSAYKSMRVQAHGLAPQSHFELFPIEIRFESALLYNIRNICLYKLEILVVLCVYAIGASHFISVNFALLLFRSPPGSVSLLILLSSWRLTNPNQTPNVCNKIH